ncbi:MAG: DUF4834 family protein [Alistipes sp.]|nr:DUF4834 family protein [Alistipes sp.]
MNFITVLFDTIVGFIRRNPLFCLLMLLIAIAAPWVFSFMLYVVLGIILLSLISTALFAWHLRRVQRRMEDELRNNADYTARGRRKEGDVRIYQTTDAPEKKVNDDVGEYVDFEEEKNPDGRKR